MEFVGQLLQKVSDREGEGRTGHWRVAQFLLQTVEMYPKKLLVDVRDGAFRRIEEFEGMLGKNVKIEFDIDAHEYQGRWFNQITSYRIYDMVELAAKDAEASQNQAKNEPKSDDPFAQMQNNGNDLPY